MLRRIHLLRKLQARGDHLSGRFGEVGGGPAGPFGPLLPLLVIQLLDLAVCEVARLGPLLVELAHHGPDQALERSLGREHLHHAAAALYLAVRALLHVVRAQPLPVRRREGEVCQRVGLGLLGHVGGLGAALAQHVADDVVHVACGRRVLRAEHALLSDNTLRVCVSCEVGAGLVWPTLIIYWIAGGCEKSSFIGAITILFVLSNSIEG